MDDVITIVNLLSGPFALIMIVLFFVYFRHHHQFHRLGIALIIAGFTAAFFREMDFIEQATDLWIATPIGVMVLTLTTVVKMVRRSYLAEATPETTMADSINAEYGDGGRNRQSR